MQIRILKSINPSITLNLIQFTAKQSDFLSALNICLSDRSMLRI